MKPGDLIRSNITEEIKLAARINDNKNSIGYGIVTFLSQNGKRGYAYLSVIEANCEVISESR